MDSYSLCYGCVYHIFNRGNNKEDIFKEERNYSYFLELFAKYISPIAVLYAYCLLPNHFHFLLLFKELAEIDENYQENRKLGWSFSAFLGTYSKSINTAYGRSGHLFGGRFRRKVVQHNEYFYHLIPYIHQNPQKHGFVDDYRNWPHSSYWLYHNRILNSEIGDECLVEDEMYQQVMVYHKDLIHTLIKMDFE